MEMKTVTFYNGYLAHYLVAKGEDGYFTATLFRYDGKATIHPPITITLKKEGRHWSDGNSCSELVEDLGKAIEQQWQEDPLFPKRRYKA
jgi:hypothetical protein